MVSFRRFVLAIAVLALFAGLASAQIGTGGSSAGGPLTCNAAPAPPTQVRAEGYTELLGDILITCTGGNPVLTGATVGTANITVNLSVPVTSRILNTTGNYSEALLLIDDPGSSVNGTTGPGATLPQSPCPTATCSSNAWTAGNINTSAGTAVEAIANGVAYNVFQGQVANTYQVVFNGIPILAPATAGFSRTFRLSNIRADVAALGGPGISTLATVNAFITVSGSSPFALSTPAVSPASVQTGLLTSVLSPAGSSTASNITSLNFLQCNGVGKASAPASGTLLRFSEGFATAFKTRVSEAGPNGYLSNGLNPSPTQNIPGAIYNSESGLIVPAITGSGFTAGMADFGTRLKAVFNNVPAGVSIYVTTTNVPTNNIIGGTAATNATLTSGNLSTLAYLVLSETAPDYTIGAGGFAPVVGGTVTWTPSGGAPTTAYQVPLTSSGTGAYTGEAVWEVIQSNPNASENVDFGVFYVYSANQATNSPAAGTYSVGQSFAPTPSAANLPATFTASAAAAASSTLPIPRFVDTTAAHTTNFLTIGLCQTTILLPFVTNEGGLETGISVANTSTDTFGTTAQSGACAMTFYGDAAGPTTTTAPCTSAGSCLGGAAVKSGSVFAATLTSILGSSFQGYAIVTCNFELAHAFVFISDTHATNLAMGYLGLIMNGGVGANDLNVRSTQAEALGN